MYTINPGDFKSKFELQELTIGVDDDNIPTEEWATIWTAKGRVRNNTSSNKDIQSSISNGSGRSATQGENSYTSKTITARFPKKLQGFDVEDTNKYKVLYKGKLYEIKSMSDIREAGKYIQINLGAWS